MWNQRNIIVHGSKPKEDMSLLDSVTDLHVEYMEATTNMAVTSFGSTPLLVSIRCM